MENELQWNNQEIKKINILDKCPKCNKEWEDNNVLDTLLSMELFREDNTTATNIANNAYGANILNNKRFSKVKVINFPYNNITLYVCHNITCRAAFNENGDEVDIIEFRKKIEEDYTDEINKETKLELDKYNEI